MRFVKNLSELGVSAVKKLTAEAQRRGGLLVKGGRREVEMPLLSKVAYLVSREKLRQLRDEVAEGGEEIGGGGFAFQGFGAAAEDGAL